MEGVSDLSSLACTSSEELEKDKDPCERDFSENSIMTKLFVLRV